MEKTLIILRHAKAEAGEDDHARRLAERGVREAGQMGAAMAERGIVPQKILCSTARRTRETLESLHIPPPGGGRLGGGQERTLTYPFQHIIKNAQALRKSMTDAESLLWYFLRRQQFGVKFRKQHPVGNYIADFACLDPKLIVELDGGQHNEEDAIKKDEKRTQFLEEQGFKILRFWNNDILQNTEEVLETIYNSLHGTQCPPPNLPPPGGGIIEFSDALYNASENQLLQTAAAQPENISSLMIIAHNPGLHQLALKLAREGDAQLLRRLAVEFPTCALVVIDLGDIAWCDIGKTRGTLKNFLTPKML